MVPHRAGRGGEVGARDRREALADRHRPGRAARFRSRAGQPVDCSVNPTALRGPGRYNRARGGLDNALCRSARAIHPRRVTPAFVFALAVILLVGGLSWRSVDALLATSGLLGRTNSVIERIQSLSIDLRDAEAGQQGYPHQRPRRIPRRLRSGGGSHPEPRRRVASALSPTSPRRPAALDQLDGAAVRLLDFIAASSRHSHYSGAPQAMQMAAAGEGYREMNAIRDTLVQAERDERVRLAERTARSEQSARDTMRNFAVSGAAAVGLLLAAAFLVRHDIRERVRVAGEFTEVNNRLASILERAHERADEIARLAELSQLLQTCQLPEEAYKVIERAAPALVRKSGGLFLVNSAGVLENHALWGDVSTMDPLFGPVDCWALRGIASTRPASTPHRRAAVTCSPCRTCTPPAFPSPRRASRLVSSCSSSHWRRPSAPCGSRTPTSSPIGARTLTATAEQIALALANLRLRDTLKSQSIRDPLTGLFNRRFLEESLERECRRSIRSSRPLSVMMLDIDHFKRFNDTFGHDAGDAVLREVGAVLRSFFRGEDVACRYGGEEFALVLTDTSAEGALARASQLRDQVHQLSLNFRRQALGPVTISVGIASLPLHATTGDALLRVSDKALYRAKHEGRDRVVLADTSETTEGALADSGLS